MEQASVSGSELTLSVVCFGATYVVLWGLTGWRSGRATHGVIVALSAMAFLAVIFASTYIGGTT
jgi:hypothetical protein